MTSAAAAAGRTEKCFAMAAASARAALASAAVRTGLESRSGSGCEERGGAAAEVVVVVAASVVLSTDIVDDVAASPETEDDV